MGKIKNMLIEMQETPIMEACSDCWGDGTIEVEHPRYRGPSRDVGVIDVETETCETCMGEGMVERLCDCGASVTIFMGRDADICMECADV